MYIHTHTRKKNISNTSVIGRVCIRLGTSATPSRLFFYTVCFSPPQPTHPAPPPALLAPPPPTTHHPPTPTKPTFRRTSDARDTIQLWTRYYPPPLLSTAALNPRRRMRVHSSTGLTPSSSSSAARDCTSARFAACSLNYRRFATAGDNDCEAWGANPPFFISPPPVTPPPPTNTCTHLLFFSLRRAQEGKGWRRRCHRWPPSPTGWQGVGSSQRRSSLAYVQAGPRAQARRVSSSSVTTSIITHGR